MPQSNRSLITVAAFVSIVLSACGDGIPINNPESRAVSARPKAAQGSTTNKHVYRFAKLDTGTYFYTGSEEEAQYIRTTLPDFRDDGIVFDQESSEQGLPVYRFANLSNGGYFYTTSEVERQTIARDYPVFRFEGSTFKVARSGLLNPEKVYRLANLVTGGYLYTTSEFEYNFARSLTTWREEGGVFEAPNLSPLAEKSWSAASNQYNFETGRPIKTQSALSDSGQAHLVFFEVNSSGNLGLKAIHGRPLDTTAIWSSAQLLDTDALGSQVTLSGASQPHFNLAVAPGGHAVVSWVTRRVCPAAVQAPSAGLICQQIVISEFNVSTGLWSPAQILDLPQLIVLTDLGHTTSINDRGNWVISIKAEEAYLAGQAGQTGYRYQLPVAIRKVDGQVTTYFLNNTEGTTAVRAVIDDQNRIATAHAVGSSLPSARVAIREISSQGVLAPAFFPQTRPTVAEYMLDLAVGKNGGFALAMGFAGFPFGKDLVTVTKLANESTWSVKYHDLPANGTVWRIFVADTGVIRLIAPSSTCLVVNRSTSGNWTATQLPSICAAQTTQAYTIFDREGNFISVTYAGVNEGAWYTYDAQRARAVQQPVTATQNTSRGLLVGASLVGPSLENLPPSGALNPSGRAILFSTTTASQTQMSLRTFK
jgi:Repeat of unknown function (DUF5648)